MPQHIPSECDTVVRMLGIAFLGLHLPLAAVGIAHFIGGYTDPGALVLAALFGTLLAAVMTLGSMWRLIVPHFQNRMA